jgi:hypothetical protein
MKKAFLFLLVAVLVFSVHAQTSYRDQCRQIIYAVKPVEAVAKVDDATLNTLMRYVLELEEYNDQEKLNNTDAELFAFLGLCEARRRRLTPDAFSLFLQEQHEQLQPLIMGKGDTTRYIKMDSWIDIFRLNLMFN